MSELIDNKPNTPGVNNYGNNDSVTSLYEVAAEIQPEGMQLDSQSTGDESQFAGHHSFGIEAAAQGVSASYYGIYLRLQVDDVEKFRNEISSSNAPTKAEVVLDFNGNRRECTFDELIAFMEGRPVDHALWAKTENIPSGMRTTGSGVEVSNK